MKIGLVGYARSGKDTVGKLIADYLSLYGHGETKQLAFGDELKNRLFNAFPEAFVGKKPRELYEKFADLGRSVDKDMWVKPVQLKLDYYASAYENFVVTDCRQPNEAAFLKDNDFILIHISAPINQRKERSKGDTNWKAVNHSERQLQRIVDDWCDFTIYNDSSIEDMKNQVHYILGGVFSVRNNTKTN